MSEQQPQAVERDELQRELRRFFAERVSADPALRALWRRLLTPAPAAPAELERAIDERAA